MIFPFQTCSVFFSELPAVSFRDAGMPGGFSKIFWMFYSESWGTVSILMSTLHSLSQWLNFQLFGITYLVGKIKFKLFFQGPLAE